MDDEPIRIPVTDVFDLHTVPAREVKPVVENYLEEAYRMGFRALRIIHGRGIGVQREMVRSILAKTPFVASFSDAPAEAGGWGATVVTLRAILNYGHKYLEPFGAPRRNPYQRPMRIAAIN